LICDLGRDQQIVGCFSPNNTIHVDECNGEPDALSPKDNCFQVLGRRHARAFAFASRKFCASFASSLASLFVHNCDFLTRGLGLDFNFVRRLMTPLPLSRRVRLCREKAFQTCARAIVRRVTRRSEILRGNPHSTIAGLGRSPRSGPHNFRSPYSSQAWCSLDADPGHNPEFLLWYHYTTFCPKCQAQSSPKLRFILSFSIS